MSKADQEKTSEKSGTNLQRSSSWRFVSGYQCRDGTRELVAAHCEKTDSKRQLKMEPRMRRTDSINDCRMQKTMLGAR